MDGVTNPPTGSPRRRDSLGSSLTVISENLGSAFAEEVPEAVLGTQGDLVVEEDAASEVSGFSGLNVDDTGPTPVPTPRTGTVTPRDSLSWEGFFGAGRGGQSPTPGPAEQFRVRALARNERRIPSQAYSETGVDPRPVVLHLDDQEMLTRISAKAFSDDPFLRKFRLITANNREDALAIAKNNRVVAIFTDIEIAQSHCGLDFVMDIRREAEASAFLTESTVPVFTVSTRRNNDNADVAGELKISGHSGWSEVSESFNKPFHWKVKGVEKLKALFPSMTSDAGSQAAAIEPSLEEAASVSGFTIA